MKNKLFAKLGSTVAVNVSNEVVHGFGRELSSDELGMVVGGMPGMTINSSQSKCGGVNDDSVDGSDD